MSEFNDDTLIHIVVPAKQWDEMWELYQAKNNSTKTAEEFKDTLWYKLQAES